MVELRCRAGGGGGGGSSSVYDSLLFVSYCCINEAGMAEMLFTMMMMMTKT